MAVSPGRRSRVRHICLIGIENGTGFFGAVFILFQRSDKDINFLIRLDGFGNDIW